MFVSRFMGLVWAVILVLSEEGAAFAWRTGPFAAWGPGVCPFFGGWTGWWPGMIMNILLWILIAGGIIYLVRRLFTGPKTEPSTPCETSRAMEILKERYARGEITVEEFQTMKSHLQ